MNKGKFLQRLFGLMTMGMMVLCANAYASSSAYIQLSSNNDQIVTKGQTAQIATMENLDSPEVTGIVWSKDSAGKVTVKEKGEYFIMVSAQAGFEKNVKNPKEGNVTMWFEVNDKRVSGSANTQFIPVMGQTKALVSQMVLSLNAGDTLSVGFAASEDGLGLINFPGASYKPSTPSISLTSYKID